MRIRTGKRDTARERVDGRSAIASLDRALSHDHSDTGQAVSTSTGSCAPGGTGRHLRVFSGTQPIAARRSAIPSLVVHRRPSGKRSHRLIECPTQGSELVCDADDDLRLSHEDAFYKTLSFQEPEGFRQDFRRDLGDRHGQLKSSERSLGQSDQDR
jgi:hypothetical protein